MDRLQTDEIAHYREQGYVLCKRPVLTDADFNRLSGIFEDLYANRAPDDTLDTPHFKHPELLEFLLKDTVLDIVEPLIGPDIGLWSSHFIAKEPYSGKATPWHEDSAYWEGRFDRFDAIVTIWLAIDKSDGENGAMRVIPGSHRNGKSKYAPVDTSNDIFNQEITGVNEESAVTFELEPDQCSLHDSRIIHGAKANTSPRRRAGYTMRYFSQRMIFNREHPWNDGFKIWHARGQNTHNNPVVN